MVDAVRDFFGSWGFYFWLIWIGLGVAIAWQLAGWRGGLLGAFFGGAVIFFLLGRKIERDSYENHARDIKEKREKAYAEIDARPVDRAALRQRLHDRDY